MLIFFFKPKTNKIVPSLDKWQRDNRGKPKILKDRHSGWQALQNIPKELNAAPHQSITAHPPDLLTACPKRRPRDPRASLPLCSDRKGPVCLGKDDSKPPASLAGPQQRAGRLRASCGHRSLTREAAASPCAGGSGSCRYEGSRGRARTARRGTARACALPPPPRPEEPSSPAAAVGARRRGSRGESAGRRMRPLDGTGAAELPEAGLALTDDAPPGASEEPAAAEAAETAAPGRCWLCRSSPCGSCAQPGECGVRTRARVSLVGGPAGASGRGPRSCGRGRSAGRALIPTLPRARENPRAVTWGGCKAEAPCAPAGAKTGEVSDCAWKPFGIRKLFL